MDWLRPENDALSFLVAMGWILLRGFVVGAIVVYLFAGIASLYRKRLNGRTPADGAVVQEGGEEAPRSDV